MKRSLTLFFAVLLLSAVQLRAENPYAAQTVPPVPVTELAAELAKTNIHTPQYDKLEEPFLFNCPEAKTLGAVLEIISKETGIEFAFKNGITSDTPAKLRLPTALPLREVLRYLEKQLNIKWVVDVENDVLQIALRDANGDKFSQQVYYVGDLLRLSEEAQKKYAIAPPEGFKASDLASDMDFEPLVDYIKTMVELDIESEEMREYRPNLSLIVRATEETHAQIASLLTNLRQYNGIQIELETEVRPLTNVATVESASRVMVFSGGGVVIQLLYDSESLVQVAPMSGLPVSPALEAQNKPILMVVPANATITLQAKAMKQRGHDVVKVTVQANDKAPETQTFYASPIQQEKEEYLTGI